jgi:hypothetical protein
MTAVSPRRLLAEAPASAIFVVVGARSADPGAHARVAGISGDLAGRRLQGTNRSSKGGSEHG